MGKSMLPGLSVVQGAAPPGPREHRRLKGEPPAACGSGTKAGRAFAAATSSGSSPPNQSSVSSSWLRCPIRPPGLAAVRRSATHCSPVARPPSMKRPIPVTVRQEIQADIGNAAHSPSCGSSITAWGHSAYFRAVRKRLHRRSCSASFPALHDDSSGTGLSCGMVARAGVRTALPCCLHLRSGECPVGVVEPREKRSGYGHDRIQPLTGPARQENAQSRGDLADRRGLDHILRRGFFRDADLGRISVFTRPGRRTQRVAAVVRDFWRAHRGRLLLRDTVTGPSAWRSAVGALPRNGGRLCVRPHLGCHRVHAARAGTRRLVGLPRDELRRRARVRTAHEDPSTRVTMNPFLRVLRAEARLSVPLAQGYDDHQTPPGRNVEFLRTGFTAGLLQSARNAVDSGSNAMRETSSRTEGPHLLRVDPDRHGHQRTGHAGNPDNFQLCHTPRRLDSAVGAHRRSIRNTMAAFATPHHCHS